MGHSENIAYRTNDMSTGTPITAYGGEIIKECFDRFYDSLIIMK